MVGSLAIGIKMRERNVGSIATKFFEKNSAEGFGGEPRRGDIVLQREPNERSNAPMIVSVHQLESAARIAMGDGGGSDPLPPGPNYGPFGYFRLALLILAALVVLLFLYQFLG